MRGWLAAAFLALAIWVPARGVPPKLAVFDFELLDTSLQGEMNGPGKDEQERLLRASDQLRKELAASGKFQLRDIAPVNVAAHAGNLQTCGGCDVQLAQKLGADLCITGLVQKVSELILVMNIDQRDAHTGRIVTAMNADLRGDKDKSWSRATSYLVRNRLLAPNYGVPRPQ